MSDMFNTKSFIKEIQGRPCLWNLNVKEYSDKVARQCAWQEIAQIMYKDWEDMEGKDKTGTIRDLQKKWKGLRDYFTRQKNKESKIKNGTRRRKKRKAPFLDMLSFLIDKKKANQQPINKTDLEKGNSSCACIQENSQEMEISVEKMGRLNDDPDVNFLLSILPDMKSMSVSQNFEFRFEVMKLIRDMKYKELNYCYNTPGASTFTHQESKHTPAADSEIDHISNESEASSTEDIKPTLQENNYYSESCNVGAIKIMM